MHKLYKLLLPCISILLASPVFAQAADEEAEGLMRSGGKIYVVMAIVITILAGLILYVARIDRKITQLEKDKV